MGRKEKKRKEKKRKEKKRKEKKRKGTKSKNEKKKVTSVCPEHFLNGCHPTCNPAPVSFWNSGKSLNTNLKKKKKANK